MCAVPPCSAHFKGMYCAPEPSLLHVHPHALCTQAVLAACGPWVATVHCTPAPTALTRAALVHRTHRLCLQHVDLGGNPLGDQGLTALLPVLPQMQALRSLSLRQTGLTDWSSPQVWAGRLCAL